MIPLKDMEFSPDEFMELYSMTQELIHFGIDPLDVWKKHQIYKRTFSSIQDTLPPINYFRRITNLPYEIKTSGRIFVSMHFSAHFRFIPFELARILREHGVTEKIWILFNRETLTWENDDWRRRGAELNFSSLVAQDPSVVRKMLSILKNGECVVAFLDATDGYGNDSNPIVTRLFYHPVRVRSGLFRIASKTGASIIPTIAGASEVNPSLHFGNTLRTELGREDTVANDCFGFFGKFMLSNPHAWLHWRSHSHRVVQDDYCSVESARDAQVGWAICPTCRPILKLNLITGETFSV